MSKTDMHIIVKDMIFDKRKRGIIINTKLGVKISHLCNILSF
jgi:hypothetical protein